MNLRRHLCLRGLLLLLLLLWGQGMAADAAPAALTPPEKPAYTNQQLLTEMLIVDASEQTLDNIPALAITFSQDMEPTAGFDDFFTVTQDGKAVPGGWVLTSNTRRLYFTHIQPNTRYRVQVRPGIAAKNGLKLQKPTNIEIQTRDIQPAFDFATKGSILPTHLTHGLPVRVVNVPELDVEFLRVQPDKLGEVLKVMRLDGAIQSWALDQVHAVTSSVHTSRYATDAKTNARETRLLPVEEIKALQEPGLYFAVMRQPGRFTDNAYRITHFVVTQIGLHVRLYPQRLDVFAHALDTGKPLAGVQVRLQGEDGVLEATTDATGRASYAQRPKGELFLTGMQEGQFAFLDLREPALDLSDYPVTGQMDKALAPFVYAPRDLYRPGESVDLSVLLRDRDGKVVPVKALNLRLVRPDTKWVREETVVATQPALGYFSHRFALPADAPTGVWSVEVRLGNQDETPLETFNFHVEEFMPERMQLVLGTGAPVLQKGEKLIVSVQGDYLYGAPAAGNTVKAVRSLQLEPTSVPAFRDYSFGNPADAKRLENVDLPDRVLNAQGGGFIEVDAIPDTITSPLIVNVVASLQEAGGRAVTRTLRQAFWPAQQLVGVRPLFVGEGVGANTEAAFEVIRVDQAGKLLASSNLSATLVREEYDYFWEYRSDSGWQRGENRNEYPVMQQKLELKEGVAGKLAFTVGEGRYRLEIEDADTKLKTVYPFHAGWQAETPQASRPDQVGLTLDKPAYKAGETVKLTVNMPAAGEALVAVEGDELLWSQPLALLGGETVVEIPVDAAWQRHDLYISVTVFRPANNQGKLSPNRALGLIHLPLDRSDRQLALSIDAPEKTLPEQPVKVVVKAAGLRSSEAVVTLAAIDVGVLNITGYPTPDPFKFYFSPHQYAVNLHDDYGKIITAEEGMSLRQRFGGGEGGAGGPRPQADVQIVSLFSGAVRFDAEGKAEIELALPGFDGRLRLMAVAMGEEQMGSAERDMQVVSPVVASLAAPRFLAAGDAGFLTVELNNTSEQEQKVSFAVTANNLLDLVAVERDVTLAKGQKEVLRLPLSARQAYGVGVASLQLTGDGFVGNRVVKLALRPAYPASRLQQQQELPADGKPLLWDAALVEPFLSSTVQARLTVSNTPPLPIASAIQGLLQYPYGCLEQTASSAYPYLFLEDDTSKQWGLPPQGMEARNLHVQEAIVRLGGMQLSSGAFTLWGSYGADEFWLTPYVTNFLLDARQQGFQVPASLLENALKYLEGQLQDSYRQPEGRYPYADNPAHMDFAARAFAAYVLAREKRAVLGTLRTLYEKDATQAVSGLPLVQLGLALSMQGDKRRGDEAIQKGLGMPRKPELYLGDYGSPLRDRAMMLYVLLADGYTVPALEQHMQYLARDIQEHAYLSTQEQVFIFLLGRQLEKQSAEHWEAHLSVNGKVLELAQSGSFSQTLAAGDFEKGISLQAKGGKPVYASLTVDAYPAKAPAVREEPLRITRQWFDLKGKEVPAAAIKVGDVLLTRLSVSSSEQVRDALVVDLLPSGFELENGNLQENEVLQALKLEGMSLSVAETLASSPPKMEEFRDDRYLAAIELNAKASYQLFYLVRVVSVGKSLIPPPYVVDMYRPDLYGVGASAGELQIAP